MCMVLTSAAAAGGAAAAGAGAGASTGIMATLATMATKVGGALATAGKAAMASGIPQAMGSGALWGAGINAAMSALQGNSIGDIAADAGKGAAVGAATGGIAKGLSIGAGKVGSLLKAHKAAKAGTEATKAGTETTANTVNAGQAANMQTAPVPGKAEIAAEVGGKPQLRPKADLKGQPISVQLKAKVNTGKAVVQSAATNLKSKAGKVAGQVGVQGALSIASGIAGAKQANAANEVSKQSLLFQQQTYNEQKAEVESNKAKLKADAWTDYSSTSLFGEQLYGSDSNNTLLTNYHTNGTGNVGNFSLLSTRVNTTKTTDLT